MEEPQYDKALVEAGRMSFAIDRISAALQAGDPRAFGAACENLLHAKIKYDQEMLKKAR
jgi:hypothetical protein